MKFSFWRLVLPILIIILVDIYVFQAVKTVCAPLANVQRRAIFTVFWSFTIISISLILLGVFTDFTSWPKVVRNYIFAVVFIVYICKVLIIPFLLVDDIIRGIKWLSIKLSGPAPDASPKDAVVTRSQFISQAALIFASVPFVMFIYGMVYGGYDYIVRKQKLNFKNLPKAFNGLKILQISDLHVGSFMNTNPLETAIKLITAQNADIIVFTGDLVNNKTEEVTPFIESLRKIHAPMGIFSILGNHDYGDYVQWNSAEEKRQNMLHMYDVHKMLGWKLFLNEHFIFERNNEKIAIAGVENWGKSLRFPKYGKLNEAVKGLDNIFTVLLSHDPSHWEGQILDHKHNISLTLSGHTHGMQFGVDTKWLKWSPVQYFYPQWAGIYRKAEKYLYVNRGLGFLGYPGRAGIRPEITVIELVTD